MYVAKYPINSNLKKLLESYITEIDKTWMRVSRRPNIVERRVEVEGEEECNDQVQRCHMQRRKWKLSEKCKEEEM